MSNKAYEEGEVREKANQEDKLHASFHKVCPEASYITGSKL